MKQITAEIMPVCSFPPEDAALFTSWMWENRGPALFDSEVIGYPRACMTKATINAETVASIPVHPVLMLESFGHRADLSDRQLAVCLLRLTQVAESAARHAGLAEAFFAVADGDVAEIASNHGWQIYMHDTDKGIWLMKRKLTKCV